MQNNHKVIQQYITENQISTAIEYLLGNIKDSKTKDEIIMIYSQYNMIQKEVRINVISKEEEMIEYSKIRKSILQVSDKAFNKYNEQSQELNSGKDDIQKVKKLVWKARDLMADVKGSYVISLEPPITIEERQNLEKARRKISEALAINNEDSEALFNEGLIYFKLNMIKRAHEAFRKIKALYPNDSNAYLGLGILNRHNGEYGNAINNYNHAMKLNPEDCLIYNNLGNVYVEIEDYLEAKKAYRKAINLNKAYFQAYMNLGELLSRLEEYSEAIEILKIANNLKPKESDVHFNLAGIHYIQGNLIQAEEHINLAREKS